jgi:hypothetical protein
MSAILLSAHVVLAILAVDPIAVAAVILVGSILPAQRAVLGGASAGRLAMATGTFNLLWVAVTILMIVRPGSSTGA